MSGHVSTFGGWQEEKSGFLGRLDLVGTMLVTAAASLVVTALLARSLTAVAVCAPSAATLVALATVRVHGLTAHEWLLFAARHQYAGARQRTRFLSGVFAPHRPTDQEQGIDLPGTAAALRFLKVPDGRGGQLTVVHDPFARTYTAVLQVRYPGLALAATDRQERRVGAWGALLESLCVDDTPLVRLGVLERSWPDDGAALRGWVEANVAATAPATAAANLQTLLGTVGPTANRRETFVTVTLSRDRCRSAIRAAGDGDLGACAVLVRELTALTPTLTAAELNLERPLDQAALRDVLRTGYDPDAIRDQHRTLSDMAEPAVQVADLSLTGPAAAEAAWGVYRHDGAWSLTLQVRGWPRTEAFATFLQPLLQPAEASRRSVALLYEPMGPTRARRELSRDRTRRTAARAFRRKTKKMDSFDEALDESRAEDQDLDRARGAGIVRFTALVTVTVTDPDLLEGELASLRACAARSGLELRRLWGAQDSGFVAGVLPLGQGLPNVRSWL